MNPADSDTEDEVRPEAWLERMRAGDAEAEARLFAWLSERLTRHARRLMGPSAQRWEEPADIVQRVLIETFPELTDPSSERTARGWVAHLMHRARWRVLDLVERRGRDAGESAIPIGRDQPLAEGASQVLNRRDIQKRIRATMDRLPAKLAEPLRLVTLDGLTHEQAGQRLGISADAVRKRCDRARRRLSDLLGGMDPS